jgi:hypothetical protein
VLRPVVDADCGRVGVQADEGGGLGVVVEELGGDVGEVAEAVPLGAALGVEVVEVVVGDVLDERFDRVGEGFAAEYWWGWLV